MIANQNPHLWPWWMVISTSLNPPLRTNRKKWRNGGCIWLLLCFFATFPRLIPNGPILVPEYSKPPRVVLDWFIEVMHSYSILVLKFSGEISVKQAIHGTPKPKSSIGFVGSHDPNPAIGVSPWVATTQATACFRRGHRRGRRLS
jgi:hypothetical protein